MQNLSNENSSARMLTEVELELMQILWKLGEGTVNNVLEQLTDERKLAYTSVSTILRILEQKSVLESKKAGRAHIYIPKITKLEYEAATIKDMLSRVFSGAPSSLVRQLIDHVDLTDRDIKEISDLVERKKQERISEST